MPCRGDRLAIQPREWKRLRALPRNEGPRLWGANKRPQRRRSGVSSREQQRVQQTGHGGSRRLVLRIRFGGPKLVSCENQEAYAPCLWTWRWCAGQTRHRFPQVRSRQGRENKEEKATALPGPPQNDEVNRRSVVQYPVEPFFFFWCTRVLLHQLLPPASSERGLSQLS